MSQTQPPKKFSLNINVCTQCEQPIPRSDTLQTRHAVPCGHVICKACLQTLANEQKSSKPACRCRGCSAVLGPVCGFLTAFCAQREGRIAAKVKASFGKQGNVGDVHFSCAECADDPDSGKPHNATHHCETCGHGAYMCAEMAAAHKRAKKTQGHVVTPLGEEAHQEAKGGGGAGAESGPATWSLCAEHAKEIVFVDAKTMRPVCLQCMASAGETIAVKQLSVAVETLKSSAKPLIDKAAMIERALAEPKLDPEGFSKGIASWAAQETARILAWEGQAIEAVQNASRECRALVSQVADRRLEVGASLMTQRLSFRASFDEIKIELADSPQAESVRLSKLALLHSELQLLVDSIEHGKVKFPSAAVLTGYCKLPDLAAEFDEKGSGGLSGAARGIATNAATRKLVQWRDTVPEMTCLLATNRAPIDGASGSTVGVASGLPLLGGDPGLDNPGIGDDAAVPVGGEELKFDAFSEHDSGFGGGFGGFGDGFDGGSYSGSGGFGEGLDLFAFGDSSANLSSAGANLLGYDVAFGGGFGAGFDAFATAAPTGAAMFVNGLQSLPIMPTLVRS